MFRVTDTRQMREMSQGGSVQEVYRVWIETEKGATGYLDISTSDWEADTLRDKLYAFAETLNLAFSVGENTISE